MFCFFLGLNRLLLPVLVVDFGLQLGFGQKARFALVRRLVHGFPSKFIGCVLLQCASLNLRHEDFGGHVRRG